MDDQPLPPNNGPRKTPTPVPAADLLVPLSEPVPDSWTSKEDDYLGVITYMIPMVASEFFAERDFVTGSGKIGLMWISGDISRRGAYSVVAQAGTGRHVEMEEVFTIGVKAFRLEPLSPPGMMTVDGEQVKYGAIQAQIHPGLARVMTRRRRKT